MSKNKGFLSILIPAATVFFSSACIMVLELVAGRLIARYLGSSLYTWTSVIGVVLAGITVGNYLGGRIADRFPARKALAVLLGISSVACVVTIILNNLIGDWLWLWKLSWPAHAFTHVFLVFMLPSTLLGTISPVVAKMALDRGLPTGRTIGDIYAFGAAGSIAGTFLAGFYLIAVMGTIAIIWTVAAALLLMAILYQPRLWTLYIWAAIFIALMTMGMAPVGWAENVGSSLALREKLDPKLLYEDESQYSYIAVTRIPETADKRAFMLDKLMHSRIVMDDILDLQSSYGRIYAAVTHLLTRDKNEISALVIGGGGYVFPRYIEKVWPGSRIDVAEIDPRVTKAAVMAFGLDKNTSISTFPMDARNYVDELLHKKRAGDQISRYDFIYEDAINDYSVPYQLTTKEFNDKIAQILTDDGIYILNLIDTYDSGRFLGSIVKTLRQTFPDVYVIAEYLSRPGPRNTVVIAARQKINLENLGLEKSTTGMNLWIPNDVEIKALVEKGHGIVITDDYAPVENMLTPVVRQGAVNYLSNKYIEQAMKLESRGKPDESLAMYKNVIQVDPTMAAIAYNNMGQILASQGKWQQAIDAAKSAIEYNEKTKVKSGMANIYYNVGLASKQLGRNEEASEYLNKAIEGYREDLTEKPSSIEIVKDLANALMEVGRFGEASEYLQQTINLNPLELQNHLMLADALAQQQQYDEAVAVLQKAITSFSDANDENAVAELQTYLLSIEDSQKTNTK
ncbi:MAG: fused MFS/spermidine synthase [Phycisphaerae bacterium]|nr:fused MFS/spermidine synthase [Phycisphaerae bacterium]MDD5381945.1 fused MFS/spermidine synthase [Phycisphaerae bacterium]